MGLSIYAIVSIVFGIISLASVLWWYICIPCAVISICSTIAGYKLGNKELNIAGVVLSSVAVGMYITLTSFIYLQNVKDATKMLTKDNLQNVVDKLSEDNSSAGSKEVKRILNEK